ncbi:zinc finger protein 724 [Bicyclus anynana]|uniref:Zinc finger protein 724 n=1 Tax=Bicyclus anynana TaxID=110368 RepID=A0A6J1NFG8_BICAN|nr:zinc finger protein 724 [Bicyclus anynana]
MVCRTCLTDAVEKDMSQLSEELKGDKKSYWDIMMFCLNIQVSPDTKLTTKLCDKCFVKILSFHEFKTLALKNDEHLRQLQTHKDFFDIDHIKCEQLSDGYSDNLLCDIEPLDKLECEIKLEKDIEEVPSSGDELLSVIKKIKYEFVSEDCKENNTPMQRSSRNTPVKASSNSECNVVQQEESQHRKKSRCKKVKIRKKKAEKVPEQREKICEECGKAVIDLASHMKQHLPATERERLKCKVCDKTFFTHGARYKHNKVKHLGIKKHCKECGKDVVNLRSHTLTMHMSDSLSYVCVSCGRRFMSKSILELHMLKHSKILPHVCDYCNKAFRYKINLAKHIRQVHDKEKTHLCQVCSKSFFSKYHLQVHLRTHTKEKPFECPDCGKCFSSTTTRNSHRLIHNDDKNYICKLCDMAFKKPSYLRVHMISHTKEKRYFCSYCDVAFGRSDHRNRHERTAHQRPYIKSETALKQTNIQ